jgi:hypothetical protein
MVNGCYNKALVVGEVPGSNPRTPVSFGVIFWPVARMADIPLQWWRICYTIGGGYIYIYI